MFPAKFPANVLNKQQNKAKKTELNTFACTRRQNNTARNQVKNMKNYRGKMTAATAPTTLTIHEKQSRGKKLTFNYLDEERNANGIKCFRQCLNQARNISTLFYKTQTWQRREKTSKRKKTTVNRLQYCTCIEHIKFWAEQTDDDPSNRMPKESWNHFGFSSQMN